MDDAQPLSHARMREINEGFDPVCVGHLLRVLKETGCRIVVSSAWRIEGIGHGSPLHNAIHKTVNAEDAKFIMDTVIGRTPDLAEGREAEILTWIERQPELPIWVAVDDFDLDLGDEHFVQTSDDDGLTGEKADELIRKLNL